MDGIAPEFARVQDRADALQLELDPNTVTEMIDEWEATNGLPDECSPALSTIAQRRAALLARLLESQGHNPADYAAIGVALGHASTSVLRRPYTPFTAGGGAAGDPLYGEEWLFAFDVHYMTNLIASPNVFTSGWATVSTSISGNVAADPAGQSQADSLAFGAGSPAHATLAIAGAPERVQFSVWLWSPLAERQARLVVVAVDGTETSIDVTVTDSWSRHQIRAYDLSGIASVRISKVGSGSAYTVYAWGAFAGAVDAVFECRLDTVKQAHTVAIYKVIGDRVSLAEGSATLGTITSFGAGTVS
jgi:uncharacterized protein YmfQ (DUF2313 family)